jgi:hypothetical protein
VSRALLLLSAVILAGCGGDGEKTAATPPKPSVTPFPTVDRGNLEPGVAYTTQAFKPNFTVTLPEGKWIAASADKADHVELEVEPEQPIQSSGIGFHHMTKVFDPVEGGEEPGDAVDGPEDFAAWLTAHPHLRASDPEPVEVMGMKGVSIEIRGARGTQKKQYKDCGKLEGTACVVLFPGGTEPVVYGVESFARFLVLEQPGGGQLAVEVWAEPLKKAEPEVDRLEAILAGAKLAG